MFRGSGSQKTRFAVVAFAAAVATLAWAGLPPPVFAGRLDKPRVEVKIEVQTAAGVQDNYAYTLQDYARTDSGEKASFAEREAREKQFTDGLVKTMTEAIVAPDIGSPEARAKAKEDFAEFRKEFAGTPPPGLEKSAKTRWEMDQFREWRRAREDIATRAKREEMQKRAIRARMDAAKRTVEAENARKIREIIDSIPMHVTHKEERAAGKRDTTRDSVDANGAIRKYSRYADSNLTRAYGNTGGAWGLSRDATLKGDNEAPFEDSAAFGRSEERWAGRGDPRFEFRGEFTGKPIETRDYAPRPVLTYAPSRFTEKFFEQSEKLARAGERGASGRFLPGMTTALGERRYVMSVERPPLSMQDINRYNFRRTHSDTPGAMPFVGPGILSPAKP